jgi:putative membrane protein
MMHWGNFSGMGFGGYGLGWLCMILFWALVIMGIIYIVKHLIVGNKTLVQQETAEQILKKRYASGEISRDEFNDRLSVISGKA